MLAEQRQQDEAAIEDERAHGRAQLEEERQLARDREQLAEAYSVQVVLAEHPAGDTFIVPGSPVPREELEAEVKQLAVMVVNRGSFTITKVEAQFCVGGNSMVPHHGYRRVTSFGSLPESLREGYWPSAERLQRDVLTPYDAGIRFESDGMPNRDLVSAYPVVRWKDLWGTRWEHKRGVVRMVADDAPWTP